MKAIELRELIATAFHPKRALGPLGLEDCREKRQIRMVMRGSVGDVGYLVDALDFVIRELELTAFLCRFGGEDFEKRTIARHTIVRAEDVVKLARRFRKHVNIACVDFSAARVAIERFENRVSKPLITTRNRLAAHVQDLDFIKRLDLWDDIDLDLVQSCHRSALDVRSALANAGVPFDEYASYPEILDAVLLERLVKYRGSTRPDALVRVRADPLAARRPNSTTILNGSPSHQRASQANLLIQWLRLQERLLGVADSENVTRMLRCRWATDLVSLVDTLVQREGFEDEHTGLDAVLDALPDEDAKHAAESLRKFAQARNVEGRILPLRSLRNGFGAHVDVRPEQPVEVLCEGMDDLDWNGAAHLFQDIVSGFRKVCREAVFLQAYAIEDAVLHGISTVSPGVVKHFDPKEPEERPKAQLTGPIENDIVQIQIALDRWIESETDDTEERHLLWNALLREGLAYTVVEDRLLNGHSDRERLRILELMGFCRGGNPNLLAKIISRVLLNNELPPRWRSPLARTLGALGSVHSDDDYKALTELLDAEEPEVRLDAATALFNMFARRESCDRFNAKRGVASFNDRFWNEVSRLTIEERLVVNAHVVSMICWEGAVTYNLFVDELKLTKQRLVDDLNTLGLEEAPFNFALARNNMVRLVVMVAENGRNLNERIWRMAAGRWVYASRDAIGHLDLAYALGFRGNLDECLECVQWVLDYYPDSPEIAVMAAEVLRLYLRDDTRVAALTEKIRSTYVLSPELARRLTGDDSNGDV